MAPTKLIKFCGFTVLLKPNNVTLSAFPEKIPETGKILLNFLSSSNVGPELTHQCHSNPIYRALLQISLARIFVFDLPLKLRVVHIRKHLKFIFSQKWLERI